MVLALLTCAAGSGGESLDQQHVLYGACVVLWGRVSARQLLDLNADAPYVLSRQLHGVEQLDDRRGNQLTAVCGLGQCHRSAGAPCNTHS